MRINVHNELIVINALTVAFILIVVFASDSYILRIILGLPFLLFFPGYTLISVLFPRKDELKAIERAALSLGFSFVVGTLLGIILNYVWEISIRSVLLSMSALVVVLSTIATYRRMRMGDEVKPQLIITLTFPKPIKSRMGILIIILLIFSSFGTIGGLIYTFTNSEVSEHFTEFYILDIEGKGDNYPTLVTEGTEGKVIVGINNQENSQMLYEIYILINGELANSIGQILLDHGQRWQEEITFSPEGEHASTVLAQSVSFQNGSGVVDAARIEVISANGFKDDDYIRIGQEVAQIRTIDENYIMLKEQLNQDYPAGFEVTKIEKIEFVLVKTRMLSNAPEEYTAFSAWLKGEVLNFKIVNLSQEKANYSISIESQSLQSSKEIVTVEILEPTSINAGEELHEDVKANHIEAWMYDTNLTLYRNQEVLYKGKLYDYFQILRLWVALSAHNV